MDSSVWIDFFSSSPGHAGRELRRLIINAEALALTGIVATEVMQGLTHHVDQVARYLSMWEILEPRGFDTYRAAAAIFRLGRSRGITLTTADGLIAAIAFEHGASVFSLDKDFSRIALLVGLKLHLFS